MPDYYGLTEEQAMKGGRMFAAPDRSASEGFGQAQRQLRGGMAQVGQTQGSNPFASRQAINAGANAQARGIAQQQQIRAAEDIGATDLAQQQWARELGTFGEQQLSMEERSAKDQQELLKQQAAEAQRAAAEQEMWGQYGGYIMGMLGAGGGAAAMSDERAKVGVEGAPPQAQDETLSDLDGHTYQYREGMGLPEGDRYGIMAQDLERSDIGSRLVNEDEQGYKRVDSTAAVPAILGLLGRVAQRLEKLEGGNAARE